jgi:very-short-patch-repair endonuclease
MSKNNVCNNCGKQGHQFHNCKLPITILCPNHGLFHQTPNGHLNGSGCPECVRDSQTSNTEEFIQKSVKLHGNKYDYSKVDYQGALNKVTINCSIHGDFDQTPNDHLRGCGCSSCFESKGEKHIATILNSNNIQFIRQKSFDECRGKSNPLRFDFFLPDLNVLIEYDGQQHFKPVDFYGGEEKFTKQQQLDNLKRELCLSNGCNLIEVEEGYDFQELISNIDKIINDIPVYNGYYA